MMLPLKFDIAGSNIYLLDNININSRLSKQSYASFYWRLTMKITSIEWECVNYGVIFLNHTL